MPSVKMRVREYNDTVTYDDVQLPDVMNIDAEFFTLYSFWILFFDGLLLIMPRPSNIHKSSETYHFSLIELTSPAGYNIDIFLRSIVFPYIHIRQCCEHRCSRRHRSVKRQTAGSVIPPLFPPPSSYCYLLLPYMNDNSHN